MKSLSGNILRYLLLVKVVFLSLMFLSVSTLSIIYQFYYGILIGWWILAPLLLPGIVLSLIFREQIIKQNIKSWTPAVFYIESLFTILISFMFFSGPMHDIALTFGSHGRFPALGLDGTLPIFNHTTVPLILFLPPLVFGLYFFNIKRRRKRGKS
jgi:hypothetical protein